MIKAMLVFSSTRSRCRTRRRRRLKAMRWACNISRCAARLPAGTPAKSFWFEASPESGPFWLQPLGFRAALGSPTLSQITFCCESESQTTSRSQADALGLGGVDRAGGHDQLLRATEPHDRGQPRGAADVGDDPELDLGQPQLGLTRTEPQI